eukprot:NODE_748_length_1666_cov_60.421053_g738_i0.p1 GENE.NODE_748_length_1666_cov_60.421053_g738_i0~~NODE_748_length_1666_cov_60.421053_g738_i0.p1  ORF type:complete len:315 (-),score=52.72 NODE_748_length_1666_cov_60.421053_g738_i0:123-1067(-)
MCGRAVGCPLWFAMPGFVDPKTDIINVPYNEHSTQRQALRLHKDEASQNHAAARKSVDFRPASAKRRTAKKHPTLVNTMKWTEAQQQALIEEDPTGCYVVDADASTSYLSPDLVAEDMRSQWKPTLLMNHPGRHWVRDKTCLSDFTKYKAYPALDEDLQFPVEGPREGTPNDAVRHLTEENELLKEALDEELYHLHCSKTAFGAFVDTVRGVLTHPSRRETVQYRKTGKSLVVLTEQAHVRDMEVAQVDEERREQYYAPNYEALIDKYMAAQNAWQRFAEQPASAQPSAAATAPSSRSPSRPPSAMVQPKWPPG